jgi:hypothetical protein
VFTGHAKVTVPECSDRHYIIHRYSHAVKKYIPNALKTVLDEAVKIVNFIK